MSNQITFEKISARQFIGLGLLVFADRLDYISESWNNLKKGIKQKFTTSIALHKDLITHPNELKEKTFNLLYSNKNITDKIVDKFILLNEESVNIDLVQNIMSYALENKYKENEVIHKAFNMTTYTANELLDNFAFISIKSEDLAIELLKKEYFVNKIIENELGYELFLKPLRRKSIKVIHHILNDEQLQSKTITNYSKILNVLLDKIDEDLPQKTIQLLEEKVVFSHEILQEKFAMRELLKERQRLLEKEIKFNPSDVWLNNQISKSTYERFNEKFPVKKSTTKKPKI